MKITGGHGGHISGKGDLIISKNEHVIYVQRSTMLTITNITAFRLYPWSWGAVWHATREAIKFIWFTKYKEEV